MSKEIHFLEDGYYVDKLEKDIEKLKEKRNQLQTMVKTYKEVIEEVREYIESDPLVMVLDYDYYVNDLIKMEKCFGRMSFIETLLQILDKAGDIDEKKK